VRLPNGEIRFGRAGLEARRRARLAVQDKAAAAQAAILPQIQFPFVCKRHRWIRATKFSQTGSPICPVCGNSREELGL
jgi:hypothetical protein